MRRDLEKPPKSKGIPKDSEARIKIEDVFDPKAS